MPVDQNGLKEVKEVTKRRANHGVWIMVRQVDTGDSGRDRWIPPTRSPPTSPWLVASPCTPTVMRYLTSIAVVQICYSRLFNIFYSMTSMRAPIH
jgi:hypothetical protein